MKGINIGSFMSSQNIHVLLLNARLISCGFINMNRLCWFIFVILIYKSDLQIQSRINAKKTQCESHKSLYLHIFSILKKNGPRESPGRNIKISTRWIPRNYLF